MKFTLNALHLGAEKIQVLVKATGAVTVKKPHLVTTLADFPAGSAVEKPLSDMRLDVQLTGKAMRIAVEVYSNEIAVTEFIERTHPDDKHVVTHPTYRTVLNTEARLFAKTISNQPFDNDILDVVRAALAQGRAEAEQLREELRKHKTVC